MELQRSGYVHELCISTSEMYCHALAYNTQSAQYEAMGLSDFILFLTIYLALQRPSKTLIY